LCREFTCQAKATMGVITCIATFAALACALGQVSSQLTYDLGATASEGIWTISSKSGSERLIDKNEKLYLCNVLVSFLKDFVGIPASVPGGIYSDFLDAELLSNDIYFRFNDLDFRWVGNESWIFTREFTGLWKNDLIVFFFIYVWKYAGRHTS
jgi:hypothetical protein